MLRSIFGKGRKRLELEKATHDTRVCQAVCDATEERIAKQEEATALLPL